MSTNIVLSDVKRKWKVKISNEAAKLSEYLNIVIDYDELNDNNADEEIIDVLCGSIKTSKKDTQETVKILEGMIELNDLILKFNSPSGSSIEELNKLKKKLKKKYNEWKSLNKNNPVYKWLAPDVSALKLTESITDQTTPTGYFYFRDLIEENPTITFVNACKNGYLISVKWLYAYTFPDVYENNCEAFCAACINNHLNIVEWFLKDVDNNIISYISNDIKLLDACCSIKLKNIKVIEFLLDNGLEFSDPIGTCMRAASFGNLEVILLLIKRNLFDYKSNYLLIDNNFVNNNQYIYLMTMIITYPPSCTKFKKKIQNKKENNNLGNLWNMIADIANVYDQQNVFNWIINTSAPNSTIDLNPCSFEKDPYNYHYYRYCTTPKYKKWFKTFRDYKTSPEFPVQKIDY